MPSLERQYKTECSCLVNLIIQDKNFTNVPLFLMKRLCAGIILGQDLLDQYKSAEITFGGPEPTLHVCGLKTMNVQPPCSLFQNLTPDCKLIAIKSRRYNTDNCKFF